MASTRPAPTTNHLSTVPRSSRLNIRTAGAERDLSSVRQLKTHCAAAITAAPASQARAASLPAQTAAMTAAAHPRASWKTGNRWAWGETGGDARFK